MVGFSHPPPPAVDEIPAADPPKTSLQSPNQPPKIGQIPVTTYASVGVRLFCREVGMRGLSEDPCQLSSRVFRDPHINFADIRGRQNAVYNGQTC